MQTRVSYLHSAGLCRDSCVSRHSQELGGFRDLMEEDSEESSSKLAE